MHLSFGTKPPVHSGPLQLRFAIATVPQDTHTPFSKKYPSKPANKASETYVQDQHCKPCWVCCQPTITSHTAMPHSLTLSSTPSCAT
jgi:hypothetical protein